MRTTGGSVATRPRWEFRPLRFDEGLVETEKGTKYPGLSPKVGSRNPEHLSFANHLHRLDPRTLSPLFVALASRVIAASRARHDRHARDTAGLATEIASALLGVESSARRALLETENVRTTLYVAERA